MSRAPRLTGTQLISALENGGFQVVRIRGSHHALRHSEAAEQSYRSIQPK
jgi:predicted RNA binding protein YcfA (HicA-like mRNA interferase family)